MITKNDSPNNLPQTKSDIQNAGHAILQIAQLTNNKVTVEFLNEVLEKLPKDEFYLAVLGLFKRGKSTLINALLGKQVLPTGVVPVTSVITRIRYGDNESGIIAFADGSTKEVLLEDLPDYVTEAGNPNNSKDVTIADVFLPAKILKDGLILIDTPGVGSTYLNGTQTTFQFLDRTDFAVFVLAVDPPVGQQEVQLLNAIALKSSKILFVLNKMDYVDADTLNESIKYCQKVIRENIAQNANANMPIDIFPISAKLALEGRIHGNTKKVKLSNFSNFEKALEESLIEKKEILILTSAKSKIEKSISDLSTYLKLEISGLRMPLDDLAKITVEFEQYIDSIGREKRELFYVIQGRAKEIINELDEDLAVFKKENEEQLVKKVEDFADKELATKQASSKTVASNVDSYLQKTLVGAYSEFIRREDSKLQDRFQELVNETDEKTNALIGDVKDKAAKLFGFQAENIVFNSSLAFKTRFYYHLDPVFMTSITFSGGEIAELLPKSLFKGILKKKLSERVRSELDKNGGRIRYDYFVTRLDQAVLKLKQDINRALETTTESVHQAIHEAEQLHAKGEQQTKDKIKELEILQCQLQTIGEKLKSS